jgi:hypothetical protein
VAVQHSPLSQDLARVMGEDYADRELTLNQVLERTEGRGTFLVIILLCLPFVAPFSIPGMSTPLGITIAVLAIRHALGKARRLPGRLGDRVLPLKIKKAILGGGLKVLRLLEKAVKPRRTGWMSWPAAETINTAVMVYAAFLLALPLPPIPPCTNMFPGYAIILIAASMMEEDGVLIWVGHAVTLGTTVYFIIWGEVIAKHVAKWVHGLLHLLHYST